MKKQIEVNPFSIWVQSQIAKSKDPIIKSSTKMIEYFFELERSMKKDYLWKYYDENAFEDMISNAKTTLAINRIYWKDMARQMEAYGVMLMFRTNEIIRTAIKSLNARKLISTAILARSLLELSSVAIENSNTYLQTVNKIPKNDLISNVSHDLEKLTLRNIWGTRLGDDIPEHLQQKNILSTIDKLTKNPNAKDLRDKYNYLCEVAHPNHLGFARFWNKGEERKDDGSITVRINKKDISHFNLELIEHIVWAIGWSSACVRNSFHIIQETLLEISKKFHVEFD